MTVVFGIPKVFTKKQCENIISFHSDWSEKVGEISIEEKIDSSYRQCAVYIPPGVEYIPNWVADKIFKTIHVMNKEHYNFNLGDNFDLILELNLLRYDSGGHYKAHIDLLDERSKRKISFTLFLNDMYEGGKLKFLGASKSEFKLETGTGDMIIFPSYLTHMVEPVTSGVRWSLVGWILGDKHFV